MANKLDIVLAGVFEGAVGLPDLKYVLHINYRGHVMTSHAVVSFRRSEDYLENIFTAILVDAVFSAVDYSGIMMAGHEDLTAVLEVTGYTGGVIYRNKYRAVLLNSDDQRIEGNTDSVQSLDVVNEQSIATASFQLIDIAAYDIRMRQVGGIFTNTTAANVLKYILSKNMLKGDYSKSSAVSSINVDSDSFQKVYKQIVIPEGTKLISVGDYLQEHYGIYNTGFGIYLKNSNWYVYPSFNVDKFKKAAEKLIIVNAPSNKYRTPERNFKVDGSTISVVCTGETAMVRATDAAVLNHGTGTRYADVSKLMDFDFNEDDKPKMQPDAYMTEYQGVDYNNSYKNIQTVKGRFSSNPAVQASNLAATAGIIITTVWEHGRIDILTPGMAVEYVYGVDDQVARLKGTLLKAELISSIPNNGIVEAKHRNVVSLSIFLKPR